MGPTYSLVQASDGNFYGTTENGGTNEPAPGFGEIFRLNVPGATSPKIVTMTLSGSQINLTWFALAVFYYVYKRD